MTVLRTTTVSTDRMTWDRRRNLLVTEASDIGLGVDKDFGRVYDDACDVGLTLVSHVTGHEVTYAINDTIHDTEGDLLYWELVAAGGARDALGHDLPALRIYND